MSGQCDDCESISTVTLSPYGNSYMAVIECPQCGLSYDTDITQEDIDTLEREGK